MGRKRIEEHHPELPARLQDVIETEGNSIARYSPLSDGELSDAIASEFGIEIGELTLRKLRMRLGIPASYERRQKYQREK